MEDATEDEDKLLTIRAVIDQLEGGGREETRGKPSGNGVTESERDVGEREGRRQRGSIKNYGEFGTFLMRWILSYLGECSGSDRTNGQRAATYSPTSQRRHQRENMEKAESPS